MIFLQAGHYSFDWEKKKKIEPTCVADGQSGIHSSGEWTRLWVG